LEIGLGGVVSYEDSKHYFVKTVRVLGDNQTCGNP
jgi:hypothetical protein